MYRSSERQVGPDPFIACKHMHATLYLMRSEMGSQCSFCSRVVMTRRHEDESCSTVLNFLERLDDCIGCAHEETVTVIKSREDVGGSKSFGCIFCEKSTD